MKYYSGFVLVAVFIVIVQSGPSSKLIQTSADDTDMTDQMELVDNYGKYVQQLKKSKQQDETYEAKNKQSITEQKEIQSIQSKVMKNVSIEQNNDNKQNKIANQSLIQQKINKSNDTYLQHKSKMVEAHKSRIIANNKTHLTEQKQEPSFKETFMANMLDSKQIKTQKQTNKTSESKLQNNQFVLESYDENQKMLDADQYAQEKILEILDREQNIQSYDPYVQQYDNPYSLSPYVTPTYQPAQLDLSNKIIGENQLEDMDKQLTEAIYSRSRNLNKKRRRRRKAKEARVKKQTKMKKKNRNLRGRSINYFKIIRSIIIQRIKRIRNPLKPKMKNKRR